MKVKKMPNENTFTTTEPDPEIVERFLRRVISIEERYAFEANGQVSARRTEINILLDAILN